MSADDKRTGSKWINGGRRHFVVEDEERK